MIISEMGHLKFEFEKVPKNWDKNFFKFPKSWIFLIASKLTQIQWQFIYINSLSL